MQCSWHTDGQFNNWPFKEPMVARRFFFVYFLWQPDTRISGRDYENLIN